MSNRCLCIRDSIIKSVSCTPVQWSTSTWPTEASCRLRQRQDGQTVSHKHMNAGCSKSNHHISVIPTVCVFYCCGTNYRKLSVRYEFIFSQFLCIRDWRLADLCLLFGIPIASARVSLGCFPFWTWPCLASSCCCRQKSVPFSCTNELPVVLLVFSRGYSESLEATRHSFALWLSLTTWQLTSSSPAGEILTLGCAGWVLYSVTNSKGLSHHLCHTIEPNQESTYSATFVIVSCLQASHNSTHTGAERRL